MTIDRVVVNMNLKIENNHYSETPPEGAVSKDFLMMKVWCEIFDFEPQISSWADKPDNHLGTKKNPGGRTTILGRKEYLKYQ